MSLAFAHAFIAALTFYLILGAVFGLTHVVFLAPRLDAGAKGSGFWFRVMIFPGAAVLWPLWLFGLILRRARQSPPKPWRRLHLRLWVVLAPLIVLSLMLSLMVRPVIPKNDTLPAALLERADD